MNEIKIGDNIINSSSEPLTIAEAGINHNGDLQIALKMIESAKLAGVSAIKFFTYQTEEFIIDSELEYSYKSMGRDVIESMKEMFQRCEFSKEDWKKIKQKCDKENILFLSTPENVSDLNFLIELGINAIKIGSDDFTNISMIKEFMKSELPIIISCGMADMNEIKQTISQINVKIDYPMILMITTSQYPTPDEDVNLSKLRSIQNEFPNILTGYSDHTIGNLAASLATGLGAKVFEKHFTLDKKLPGPDHWFSASPNELKEWNDAIKKSFILLGNKGVNPTEIELKNKTMFRRKLVALKIIEKNEQFSKENIGMRRTKNNADYLETDRVIGHKSKKRINRGEIIDEKCIE